MNIKNVFKVGLFTLVSRFLGLVRDILMARYLGAGVVSDAFFVAFKIPNLFRKFFAEGSMQGAFVPIFSDTLYKNPQRARMFSKQIFTLLFLSLIIFTLILEIFAPYVVKIISPGFYAKGEAVFNLTVFLLRIMLPYLVFVSLSAFYSSILNTLGKFSLVAFLPALLNIFMILCLLIGNKISYYSTSLAFGVLLGGISQLGLVLFVCYKQGWIVLFTTKISSLMLETKGFFKKVVPVMLGAGVYQVNIIIDVMAASFLAFGSISYLFYADRLYQLPLAIIGIGIGSVMLPFVAAKSRFSAEEIQNAKERSFLLGWGLGLPATLGLLVLSPFIIPTIFFGGNFDEKAVIATSGILALYSISLPFNVLIKVMLPVFYAEGDTKTPFYSTVVCLCFNVIFVFVLAYYFSYFGIALATSLASIVNFLVLRHFLQKRGWMPISLWYIKQRNKVFIINIIFLIILIGIYFTLKLTITEYDLWFRFYIIATIVISIIIFVILLRCFKSFLYNEIITVLKRG